MTLEELKAIVEGRFESDICVECGCLEDIPGVFFSTMPAALELIEQMAEALSIALRTLDAETRHGRTLSGHNALAAYEAFKKNVGGE